MGDAVRSAVSSDEYPAADVRTLSKAVVRLSTEMRDQDHKHTAAIHDLDKRTQRVEDGVAQLREAHEKSSGTLITKIDDIARHFSSQADTKPIDITKSTPHTPQLSEEERTLIRNQSDEVKARTQLWVRLTAIAAAVLGAGVVGAVVQSLASGG